MPWIAADAKGKTSKADTPKKQKAWAKIANKRLKTCKAEGGTDCEASAIKVANAAIAKMGEAFGEWLDEQDDETQGLVEDHIHGLKTALRSERQLRRDAVARLREAQVWSNDVRDILRAALLDESPPLKDGGSRYWVKDISVDGNFFVYEDYDDGNIYKRSYVIGDGGKVTMGDPQEVRVKSTYEPVTEAAEILGDFVALTEKSVRKDGTIPVKIVAPGWGTSGYYPPEVLQRDAKTFTAGTQMFWDHPTEDEESARPEGSLRNLAGELAGDAYWDEANVMGPGLYADAHVFKGFQGAVDELAPHIGVSLRGLGKAKDGEVDGKSGPIVQEIATVQSVDFVTMPGAGGKVLQLFESARDAAGITTTRSKKMEELKELTKANDQLAAELTEAKEVAEKAEKAKTDAVAEVAKLKEGVLLREARDFVSGKLAGLELPDMTQARLIESLSKNPPIKDGALDEDTYVKSIDDTVKAEAEYLAKVAGSGVIKGMGGSGDTGADEAGSKALYESFYAKFTGDGMSAEEAKAMAETAATGR